MESINWKFPLNSKPAIWWYRCFGKIVYNEQIEFNPVTMELDLTHLPTASYNIDLYPENNNDRIFYMFKLLKSSYHCTIVFDF